MTIKEFADIFDNPCSMEELLFRQEGLLECDFIDEEILEGLLNAIQKENKPLIDRDVVIRAIITDICTTGEFGYFIRGVFKELLEKDGCSKEDINNLFLQANKQSTKVRRVNYEKRQADRKKREEEKRRKEEALKKLEENIDMSKSVVSYDTARFLIRNGMTYEELERSTSITMSSQEDIDPILHKYRIESDKEKEMVSIADVVGYDYNYLTGGNNLLKAFPNFFDSSAKDGYHIRSLSMLDLTTENGVSALFTSFQEEPIKLADAPGGKYTISGNGMHRYSILRSLYLIEMVRANGDSSKEQSIREKYTIPTLVSKVDYVKTYSNFVLSNLKLVFWLGNERDNNNALTGRAKVELTNGDILFLTNEELIAYVGNAIRSQKDYSSIQWLLEDNPSFSQYLSLVVPEMVGSYSKENENAKTI